MSQQKRFDDNGNLVDEPDPYSNYQGDIGPGGAWGYDPDSNSYLHNPDGSLGSAAIHTGFAPTLSGRDDGSQFGPATTTGGGGGGTGGGGTLTGLKPWTGTFNGGNNGQWTMPDVPAFKPPALPDIGTFSRPAPFTYDQKFVAPTKESILADPSYDLRRSQGEGALINNQAAQGLQRGGASLKGLIDYNQQFASNEYKDIWNRDLGVYQMNYGNAANEYDRTYKQLLDEFGVNRDTKFGLYDRELSAAGTGYQGQLEGYRTQAQAAQRSAEQAWQHEYDQYQQQWREYQANQDAIRWTYDYEANQS